MKKITFNEAKNSPELITLINVSYHDVEAKYYDSNHPEILNTESESWERLINEPLKTLREKSQNLKIADFGTGTGFVPETISGLLKQGDLVYLCDISNEMLDKAEQRLSRHDFDTQRILIKDNLLNIENATIDLMTMNSVLHHIAEPEKIFLELRRVLKIGGILVIKHEPNVRFGNNLLLRFIFNFIKRFQPKSQHDSLASNNLMHNEVISALKDKGYELDSSISMGELQSLVDVHSPTAKGGLAVGVGFDPYKISSSFFENNDFICRTYGYFGKFNDQSNVLRRFASSILQKLFPKDGYFFDIVIIKK